MSLKNHITVSEIINSLSSLLNKEHQEQNISNDFLFRQCFEISTDTRNISENSCFIPLIGERFNGHDFIETAIEKTANVIIHSQKLTQQLIAQAKAKNVLLLPVTDTLLAYQHIARYYRDQLKAKVIAITGSTGKTTTRSMIVQILSKSHLTHTNQKNFNNMVGVPKTILECPNSAEYMVLEMGINQQGEMERLSFTGHPDIALVLNVHNAHLEFLKSYQNVVSEKAKIFDYLKNLDSAIIPSDNYDLLERVKKKGLRPFTFSATSTTQGDSANITLKGYHRDIKTNQIIIQVNTTQNEITIPLKVFGMQFITDAVAAISIAIKAGISDNDIISGLSEFQPIEGRFYTAIEKPFFLIDDTYNANVNSMKAAIEALSLFFSTHRKILVLADMKELGDFSEHAHAEIGNMIHNSNCNLLVTYGDNARIISETALKKGFSQKNIYHGSSQAEILDFLKHHIKQDDCILVKGSHSMKMDFIILELKKFALNNDYQRK